MQFQQVQQAFIAHIKDPQQPVPAGIEERRMAIYRELLTRSHASRAAGRAPSHPSEELRLPLVQPSDISGSMSSNDRPG